jgi:flagellar protein FliO/FliZ
LIFIHAFARSAYNYAVLATFAILPAEVLADVSAPGVSAGTMLQTGLGLLLVFGLLFAAAYLLRKFNPGRGFGRNGPLRVVGGLMISTRERIVLLEVGDVWLVVGVGPGQIRTLHTMPKGEALPGTPDEKPFGQWLKQIIEHKNEAR